MRALSLKVRGFLLAVYVTALPAFAFGSLRGHRNALRGRAWLGLALRAGDSADGETMERCPMPLPVAGG
jgi:hypothetical protein